MTASSQKNASLGGRTAIITGAASGIGAEIARQLAAAGATVLVTDITPEAIDRVVAEIAAGGGTAAGMVVDVTRQADLQGAVDRVVAEHGRLDYLFNNAGVAIFGEVEEVTLADWDKIIDVNLRGVAYGTTIAYQQMVRQGHGHIVNTASVAGLVSVPLQAHYCTTKHAVVGLSKTVAVEAAEHGVVVTTFCPAFVESGMFDNHTTRGSTAGVDARRLVPVRPLATRVAVRRLLRGIQRRRELVITPFYGRVGWWLERVSPALSGRVHRILLRRIRDRAAQLTASAN
jgi:NAD(P)-dependent dehydrogenase (short-subunit alcohol dehydrogenase family)